MSQSAAAASSSGPAMASGPLLSNVAVIFGATGNVGSGIAANFISRGYTVACPVRDMKRITAPLNKLIDSPRLLIVEEPALDSLNGMRRSLKAITDKFGDASIKSVIACFGCFAGCPTTPLYSATEAELGRIADFHRANQPYFFAWAVYGRYLIERNLEGSSFFLLSSAAGADGSLGVLSLGCAMQQGVARVATHEAAGTRVEFRELRVDQLLIEDDEEFARLRAAGQAPNNMRDSTWFGRIVPAMVEALAPISRAESASFREKVRYQDAHVITVNLDNFDQLLAGNMMMGGMGVGGGEKTGVAGAFQKVSETVSHLFSGAGGSQTA